MPAGIIPNVASVVIVVMEIVVVVRTAEEMKVGIDDNRVEILGGTVHPHANDKSLLNPQ